MKIDMFWGGDRYYEVREDGHGDVHFTTSINFTYGGETSVMIESDTLLALADEIRARRERAGTAADG